MALKKKWITVTLKPSAAFVAVTALTLFAVHEVERPVLDFEALAATTAQASSLAPGSEEQALATQASSDTFVCASASRVVPGDWTVDLHAHLFMKPGMGFLFRGGFFKPLRARSWKNRFRSQANAQTLQDSKIGLMVVALYANPIFTWSPRSAIREEIRQAELFVSQHPNEWIIARSAEQARQAIAQGKRAMVLSLERASWVLESEADLREFIDEKGIRIVTFVHLTDDRFGGAAFLKGYHQLSDPWRWFVELFKPVYDRDGVKVNAKGMKRRGFDLAHRLIDRGVWIDLSHSSDATQRDLVPLVEQAGQPLLYTHGALRRFTRTERGTSDDQLVEVARHGGVVGICPTEDEMNPTRVPTRFCGQGCRVPCDWGLPAFVAQFAATAEVVGAANVFVGSDFNGALPHLHPSCGTGTELDRTGFWNLGQTPIFWQAARRLGAPLPARLTDQIDSFITQWSKVRARRI